jgi:hypothetical protein
MTPEVLAAQDGVLSVFMRGAGEWGSDSSRWRDTAGRMFLLADALQVDDLTLHVADAQAVRLLGEHSDRQESCVVVYLPTCKAAKSLPRAMRRCIEHVRAERRKAEREEVQEADRDDRWGMLPTDGDDGIDPQGRTF